MNGLQQGLGQGIEQGLGQVGEIASYLGLAALVLAIGLALVPFVLWWNTARTNRLLSRLIDEQEQTNELLRSLAGKAPEPADSPEDPDQFTLS